MKMIWTRMCIAWSLFCAAACLQCHRCNNSACSTTTLQTCTANQSCISAKLDSSVGMGPPLVVKSCIAASICLTTGKQTFSANLGRGTGIASVQCCSTDGCNADTLTVPSASQQTANGLSCFTCDNQTATVCNISLACVGMQDRCVNGTVGTVPAMNTFGCVSSNFCGSSGQLSLFPPLASLAYFTEGPTCCEGNCCNAAGLMRLGSVAGMLWMITVMLT